MYGLVDSPSRSSVAQLQERKVVSKGFRFTYVKPGNQNIYAKKKLKNLQQKALVSRVPPDLSSHVINLFTFQVTCFLKSLNTNFLVRFYLEIQKKGCLTRILT